MTLAGSGVDLFLGIAKIITGFFFHSHALLIDGLHSLTDLLTDFFVLFITKISHEKPDERHPYGHGRFETVGTVVLGSILLLTAGALLFETAQRFFNSPGQELPGDPVFAVAIISIVAKEAVFQYSKKVGEELNSPLLIANAWHSRSDAITTIVVLAGALFSVFGFPIMDSIAAFVVSIFIGKIGWDFLFASIQELVDTSLEEEKLQEIRKLILSIPGVLGMHDLRSRMHGHKAVLDVNIQVSPHITVSEGHEISSWVMKKLIENFEEIEDVTVHTDVEDDRLEAYTHRPLNLLPLRDDLEKEVKESWKKVNTMVPLHEIHYHYLGGRIQIELYLLNQNPTPEELQSWSSLLRKELSQKKWFKDIRIWVTTV